MKTLLRKAREAKGFGTLEVARLLQIDAALISKFESGQRQPTKKQLLQLAQLFEINADELTILWLKEKILKLIESEPLGIDALKQALAELEPPSEPSQQKNAAIDALFDEMAALKSKLEGLRNST